MKNVIVAPRIAATVAALSIAALLLTGCTRGAASPSGGATASPGITGTTLSLGISTPLSGPNAGPGTCSAAGLDSYLQAKDATGGFKFGDGKTRKVSLTYLDDAYDPAKAVSNFRQLVGQGIFAYVGALGTPGNAAVLPLANQQKVPQVLLMTGASNFSDASKAPWTMGLFPTYYDEGYKFGQLLAGAGKPVTVAILAQNDDYGTGYVDGFTAAIKGSSVKVVGKATYEPTDATVDSQVTQLAATKADDLLSAVAVTPLQVGVLTKAQSLGWKPRIFLPGNSSTPATILIPGNATAYPDVYTTSFSKTPVSPAFANDSDVKAYNAAFAKYGSKIAPVYTPICAWAWTEGAILEQAFKGMKEPTREAFMTSLRSIKNFDAPLLLPGSIVNTTNGNKPAINGLSLVQWTGTTFIPTTKY